MTLYSPLKKWGLTDSAACECDEPEQTVDDIIDSCPLHRPPSETGLLELEVGPLTTAWLQQTVLTNSIRYDTKEASRGSSSNHLYRTQTLPIIVHPCVCSATTMHARTSAFIISIKVSFVLVFLLITTATNQMKRNGLRARIHS